MGEIIRFFIKRFKKNKKEGSQKGENYDNSQFLRGFAKDEQKEEIKKELEKSVIELKKAIESRNDKLELYYAGRCGEYYRMLGDLDLSKKLLERAFRLSVIYKEPMAIRANTIRLATAYQYTGKHLQASIMLEELIHKILHQDSFRYLDFAYQHLGKIYVEMRELKRAKKCFDLAADLRKDQPVLLESTMKAICELKKIELTTKTISAIA